MTKQEFQHIVDNDIEIDINKIINFCNTSTFINIINNMSDDELFKSFYYLIDNYYDFGNPSSDIEQIIILPQFNVVKFKMLEEIKRDREKEIKIEEKKVRKYKLEKLNNLIT